MADLKTKLQQNESLAFGWNIYLITRSLRGSDAFILLSLFPGTTTLPSFPCTAIYKVLFSSCVIAGTVCSLVTVATNAGGTYDELNNIIFTLGSHKVNAYYSCHALISKWNTEHLVEV